MPAYGTYCPVSMASEVIADRWTPLIIRELVLGNTRFNDIARGLPGISRSLLASGCAIWSDVVCCRPGRRRPAAGASTTSRQRAATSSGSSTASAGGRSWLFDEFRPHDVAPTTLMWWMHRRVDRTRLPPRRTVVEFRHTAPAPEIVWLVLDPAEVSVCLQDPGFDVDLVATASTPALADVFQGLRRWSSAVDAGLVQVAGAARLADALPGWFLWSPWAEVTRERAERAAAARP